MQTKPSTWPISSTTETLPELYLALTDSAWPPARDGAPTGTTVVAEWDVTRDLTGGMLPGQVRAATGYSVATGSVSFPQPAGAPLSPWARGNLRVGAAGRCRLYASHAGADQAQGLPLGAFTLAPVQGSNADISVSLELEDETVRLKRPINLAWTYDPTEPPMDAAWAITEACRRAGYPSVPGEYADSIQASAPLLGRAAATNGALTTAAGVNWATIDHMIGLGPGAHLTYATGLTSTPRDGLYASAMVAGRGGMITRAGITLDVRPDTIIVRQGTTAITTITLPATNMTWRAVKINIIRTSTTTVNIRWALPGDPLTTNAGTFTLPNTEPAWTNADPITVATDTSNGGGTTGGRWIRGVKVHHLSNFDFPTFTLGAKVEPTGSTLNGIFDAGQAMAWDMIQEIASATLGAAWMDEQGRVIYRSRSGLRGDGTVVEDIEALDAIESLEWSIDPGEIADRCTITYTPTTALTSTREDITIWEATDPIQVRPRGTVTIAADITGTTDHIAAFRPVWDETATPGEYSRWAASTTPDGGGERPADTALTFAATLTGPARVKITITNTTTNTYWLVDGTGQPTLTLRTSTHVAPGEQATLATGVSETNATNPVNLDAGAWIQDPTFAARALAWTAAQTSRAQAVISDVRVTPDLARQLGDIVRLTDGATGLHTKAIVKGIKLSGDSTGYQQNLTLALLDVTFDDWDAWLTTHGISTFDQLDTWLAAQGISTFDQLDTWLDDLGGTR